jgi:hypothetical protein
MKRLSRREQIMAAACVVALLWFGVPMLWGWLGSGTPSAAVSAERLHAAQREQRAQTQALTQLQQQMRRLAPPQPPAAMPAQVMAALDRRAQNAGIQLREVRPLPPQPLDGATGVPLQLSFTAPFPQAARFLTRLRVAPDGLAVDRIVIAAMAADSDQVTVQARVLAFSSARESQEVSRG